LLDIRYSISLSAPSKVQAKLIAGQNGKVQLEKQAGKS